MKQNLDRKPVHQCNEPVREVGGVDVLVELAALLAGDDYLGDHRTPMPVELLVHRAHLGPVKRLNPELHPQDPLLHHLCVHGEVELDELHEAGPGAGHLGQLRELTRQRFLEGKPKSLMENVFFVCEVVVDRPGTRVGSIRDVRDASRRKTPLRDGIACRLEDLAAALLLDIGSWTHPALVSLCIIDESVYYQAPDRARIQGDELTMHPRSGVRGPRSLDRRRFLRDSAAAAVAMSSLGALLSACGDNGSSTRASAIKIASPENPVTLDLFDDNPAIDSNLEPEAGPLKLFNWSEYIWPRVVKDFQEEYGVEVEITTFYNMSEALAKLRTGSVDFDVFFPTIDVLPRLVAAKLLQPVNHDYLPNLQANVWPELTDPFYDRKSRYTLPYTVYTTGIGYSVDVVTQDVGSMENPHDVFWDSEYAGKVGIYDDYREAMTMVMLRNGHTEINTGDPEILEETKNDLHALSDAVRVKTTIDGAYVGLPEGKFAVHQAWSGDMVSAPLYMPRGGDPSVLRYWTPPDGSGAVGNDLMSIPTSAKNPVLAHHFVNFMLDNDVAIKNFSWVGYQPPLVALDPDRLVSDEYVLETLEPAIVGPENFRNGRRQLALPPDVDARWQRVWSEFKAGA